MRLCGPDTIKATLDVPRAFGSKSKRKWQYHSRSDLHSKAACWGILVDMLQSSSLLRKHIAEGRLVVGVNHTMRDFQTNRKKDLDLVVGRPDDIETTDELTLEEFASRWRLVLTDDVKAVIEDLPLLRVGPVGSAVLIALEAKAAMTAHVKALPRLHDELDSSHSTVHGASDQALAVGFVMVNLADKFLSSDRNKTPRSREWTKHRQPNDTLRVLEKMGEIRRRRSPGQSGYDAFAIMVVELQNDGTPFVIVEGDPAPKPGDSFNYASMIARVANEYDSRFASI